MKERDILRNLRLLQEENILAYSVVPEVTPPEQQIAVTTPESAPPALNGKAKKQGFTAESAVPEELAMGMEVEKEHTDDPNIARTIALDHLAEFPDYYTRLKKMEEEAAAAKQTPKQ